METNPTETIYGKSLGLNIPILTCDNVGADIRNVFIRPQDNVYNANVYLINMINCFVDFFIQYQTIEDEPLEFSMQTLLDLKKAIFSFCLVNTETNYFESFFSIFQERFNACIIMINNRFNITQNIGAPTASSMELEGKKESFLWFKRKAANLFLLGLSYKFLSMSSSLGIHIKDMTADTDNIIETEKKRQQSFILQFLPRGEPRGEKNRELKCFKKVDFFFFEQMNSVVFEKILVLAAAEQAAEQAKAQQTVEQAQADAGGSKRVNNKSRKNKYKHKYNHKYKKSRKNKRHRRKRTQSTQNKMF
jgi:hypothetical protein